MLPKKISPSLPHFPPDPCGSNFPGPIWRNHPRRLATIKERVAEVKAIPARRKISTPRGWGPDLWARPKCFLLRTLTQFEGGEGVPVARLILEIEIPHAQSLKDRRQVVRSMKDKLRQGFNLSVAELDEGLVWNRATLGIATISSSMAYLTGQNHEIDRAAQRIATTYGAEIVDSYVEILPDAGEPDANC